MKRLSRFLLGLVMATSFMGCVRNGERFQDTPSQASSPAASGGAGCFMPEPPPGGVALRPRIRTRAEPKLPEPTMAIFSEPELNARLSARR